MKIRAFSDTGVFIYAFEFPDSNSAKIIELLNEGEIEVVISEQVIKEVFRYFEKFYGVELARKFRRYLIDSCIVIMKSKILNEMNKLKRQIKEKDLEQFAVTRKLGIKYLIAYDKDFENVEEYFTPKKFLEKIGKEFSEEEF